MTQNATAPTSPSTSDADPTPIRFGMIGCGALGVVHARRLTELPGVEVVGVSDPDTAAMQRVIDVLPQGHNSRSDIPACADYRDLLRVDGLDAVCISSPNRWHVEQLLASLERGCHVLCEKPLSMEPDEVQRVVDATHASGRIVAIAYQSRYRRSARMLRTALRSGKWGRITSVSIFSCEDWVTPNRGTWRHDPARCPGGFFVDANGHQFDVMFWVTGLEAAQVRATTETRGTPVPMFTWGEARLRPQGEPPSGRLAQAPLPPPSGRLAQAPLPPPSGRLAQAPLPPPSGRLAQAPLPPPANWLAPTLTSEGIPLTFTCVGDARHWGEEIAIQTEGADFLIRDTQLFWSDGSTGLALFPESLAEPADLDPNDTPDKAYVAAMRGGRPVASPPETVWPVLRFTLAALASAANGSTTQSLE